MSMPGILRRFVTLWAAGLVVHYAAWLLGYRFLPEGVLRGVFWSSNLPLEGGGAWTAAGRIILFNGVIAAGLILLANLFRVKDFPLGYLPVLVHWALYGLFLGTDSFSYPQGGKIAPSLSGLVGRIGFAEITGYTLVAAATAVLYQFRQTSWTDWSTVRERRWRDVRLGRGEWIALAIAALLILYGGVREGVAVTDLVR